jgi:hypothetical protein
MKTRLKLFFLLLLTSTFLLAQKQNNPYLFDTFKRGKIIYKKGDPVEANFNYDTAREILVFLDTDSVVMEIDNTSNMAALSIDNRIFEHIGKGTFYERIPIDDSFLYVRWQSKRISEGRTGAYGTRSPTSSISSIGQYNGPGGVVRLKDTEEFSYSPSNYYYLKINNKFKRFSSDDSLFKLFKGREDEIKKYIEEENINLKNIDDIKKIVAFCLYLEKKK